VGNKLPVKTVHVTAVSSYQSCILNVITVYCASET